MLDSKLERILPRVQKPARYVGGEWGSVSKKKDEVDLRFAFCFPDVYEVGMSHLGSVSYTHLASKAGLCPQSASGGCHADAVLCPVEEQYKGLPI